MKNTRSGITINPITLAINKKRAQRWIRTGEKLLAQGSSEEALACLKKAIHIHARANKAHLLMASALMPGSNYLEILSSFHRHMQPKSYVEIGIGVGNSLTLVNPETKAVAIDPSPNILNPIRARAKIYPVTSDDFFKRYNLFQELGTDSIDLVFIDGLHIYEQIFKDFINIEKYSDKKTVVLIHDCLPVNRSVAARSSTSRFWCGDVWKIIPCLSKYRPDLNIRIIPTPPSGLGMITSLDSGSRILAENFDRITAEYHDKELDYDYLDKERIFMNTDNLVHNDWEEVSKALI
ncbi:MAG TPA: class I SAM-dependent methyltransferase [Deltaproteobacteria bacterium]|nr:class I SAM-dependent methyltransferase [Deltaproteobacteria bacterium]